MIGGIHMNVIIDRFEGAYAVVELEDKQFVNMPRELLPAGAKEGSVISIMIDQEETNKRRKGIEGLMNQLWTD
jgi:hypothetical protein